MTRTAVLYGRVSTREQAESGYSLRQQIERLKVWCEDEGYEVLEEVTDPGQSGAHLERPGLDRVRDLVQGGGIAAVVAQDADRITRDPIHRGLLDEEFERFGTRLVALDDWGDDSHEGQLLRYMKGWVSQGERLKMVERSRRGKNRMVTEGKLVRGPRPPYGFIYDEHGHGLVVEPTQMAVVRRIFEMLAVEGLTMGEVVRRLTREGIPSPMGANWHKPTIRNLVLNNLYRPLTVEEVTDASLVSPEVVRSLDREKRYGLWTWNKRYQRRWRERGEGGQHRDRYEMVPRPRAEWLAVPVLLSGADLSRAHVDAARKRISGNKRRPPSTVAGRFWQLSGGIVRCAECGSVLSAKARQRPSNKTDFWYTCRKLNNSGSRACTHTRCYRADVLEETIWTIVHSLLSDPQRLLRQYKTHLRRKREQMRENPEKEVHDLAGRLQKLDQKEGYLLDVAADTSMPKESLRTKLAELEEQRKELRKALREAEARQHALRQPRKNLADLHFVLLQMDRMKLNQASPEDRRRLYEALRLQAIVDREGKIRLNGIFDPDVYLPGVLRDPPADPRKPRPKVPNDIRVQVTTPCARCVTTSDTRRAWGGCARTPARS